MIYSIYRKAIATFAWLSLMSSMGVAHELRPAVADIDVRPDKVFLVLIMPIEPLIAGMDLSAITNTNDSPFAQEHDDLRTLPPAQLEEKFRQSWPFISSQIIMRAGDKIIPLKIDSLQVPPVGNPELPRDSILQLSADLPGDDTGVALEWGRGMGLLALRQIGEGATYEVMLSGGQMSASISRSETTEVVGLVFFYQYIKIGFEHIVPKGLDHILFVLGLFLFSTGFRFLLWQVTTFTVAHTLTLALASLGIVSLSAAIVEPLIAASITYVAVENIIGGKLSLRRLFIIFAFGLLHGLGFASVLGDIGIQPSRFLTGLIGFNVGVELGQLAVILIAFVLVGYWMRNRESYRKYIVIPGSALIGLIGAYWFVERVFF